MGKRMIAIGLMSGTSMDSVDLALISTDGECTIRCGDTASRPYSEAERAVLAAALEAAPSLIPSWDRRQPKARWDRSGVLGEAEKIVTDAHIEAVTTFLTKTGYVSAVIDVIGFHGQTVLHRPEIGLTVQLGDALALAQATGIDVVFDLRDDDMVAGGQGAPLVPVFHAALVAAARLERPVAVLNIGGVANVSYVGPDDQLIAFDTGPGNALLDDWVRGLTGKACDEDGALASAGRIDEAALARMMDHPYFAAPGPKSLDRNAFALDPVRGLSPEDGAATLTAFTASAVARALDHLPEPPRQWIVAGGGARNPAILDALRARLDAPVTTAEAVGWSSEFMEAQAFGYLAVRSLLDLPLTFPGTTGVPEPMGGGLHARVRPRRD